MRSSLRFLFCALLSVVSIGQAHASKPLSIVVPFPPGGAVDRLARVLAQQMGIEIETSTAAAFGELINKDAQTYGPVIKKLNIKLD